MVQADPSEGSDDVPINNIINWQEHEDNDEMADFNVDDDEGGISHPMIEDRSVITMSAKGNSTLNDMAYQKKASMPKKSRKLSPSLINDYKNDIANAKKNLQRRQTMNPLMSI